MRQGTKYNKRDERGWRVPKFGTKSYTIYVLMKEGKTNQQISEETGFYAPTVGVLIHKIKHPETVNKWQRKKKRHDRTDSQVVGGGHPTQG